MIQTLAPVPEEAFSNIIAELQRKPLPMNPYRINSGEGRSAAFGFVNRRCLPPGLSRNCWLRPKLYHYLLEFARSYVPFQDWDGITLNQDYQTLPHKDKGNEGLSYIVAFGDYQNGRLVVEGHPIDIRHSPVLFNGSQLTHSTEAFTGRRYSIVFYRLTRLEAKPETPTFTPEERDGKWVLVQRDADGAEVILRPGAGLPHPLLGRKKNTNATQ